MIHVLTQWCLPPPLTCTVKLSLFTHVLPSPLSLAVGDMDVVQAVLIILTMVGLFLDRLYTYISVDALYLFRRDVSVYKFW